MSLLRIASRYLLGSFRHLPRSLWAIFCIQVVMRAGDFAIPFLTLFLTRKMGLDGKAAGFWVTSCFVAGLLGTLVAGKVSDQVGGRRVLATCMIGTGLLVGLCGLLTSSTMIPPLLVAASFFQGSMRPVISAMIMTLCPAEQRKDGFSLSYLGINLGVAVGPSLAGFLFERHLPWIFFGNALALIGALNILLRWVPNPEPGSTPVLPSTERAVAGSSFRAFLERPLLVTFCGLSLMVSFAYSQTGFGLTLYTSKCYGAGGASAFGTLISLNGVVVLLVTTPLTRLTHRLSAPAAMALGTVLYAIGFGMLAFELSFGALVLSTIIWTIGEVLLATNTGAYLASHTPVNFRGRFQSIRELSGSIGRIFSPIVCGAIIDHAGVHVSWAVVALVTVASSIGFAGLHRWELRIAERTAAAPDAIEIG